MTLLRTNQPSNQPGGIPVNDGPPFSYPAAGQVPTTDGHGNQPLGPGGGGVSRLPGPDGNPTTPVAGDVLRPAIEAPVAISRNDGALLFAPNPQSELDVLNDGGVMYGNAVGYFSPSSSPRAQLVTLPGLIRKGFQLAAAPISGTPYGVPIYSLDGILALARWQIVTWLYLPGASDLSALGNLTLWQASWGATMVLSLTTSVGFLKASLSVAEAWTGGANANLTAQLALLTPLAGATIATTQGSTAATITGAAPAQGMWLNSANLSPGTYVQGAPTGTGPYNVTLSAPALATASGTPVNGADVPAQTLVPIVVSFDGNNLALRLANNQRNNTSAAYTGTWLRRRPSADLRPRVSGGLSLLSATTHAADAGVQIAVAIIDTPQTPAASSYVDRTPKIRVDAANSITGTGITTNGSPVVTNFAPATVAPHPGMAVSGANVPAGTQVAPNGVFGPKADGTYQLTLTKNATGANAGLTFIPSPFPRYLAGVVKPYSAWQSTVAAEATDPGAGWRAAQCSLLAGLGISIIRDADYHLRAIPTLSATPGQITSTDLTGVYDRLDRVHAGYGGQPGVAASTPWRLHLTISYTPAALGGTAANSYHEVPNVNGWTQAQVFAAWGQWAVQILQGINARYPGVLYSVTPWNEPENTWKIGANATVDNFALLWLAAAQAIQAANIQVPEGQLYASGVDGEYNSNVTSAHGTGGNGGDYQRQMLATAQANAQAIPGLHLHSYDSSLATLVENIHGLTAEASSRGVLTPSGATPPVRVTEINWTLNYGGDATTLLWGHSAKDTLGPSLNGAAYLLAAAHEIAAAGGDMMTVYRGFPPSTYLTTSIGEEVLGIAGASATPRPWPQGSTLELLAKNSGSRAACDTNRPNLRAFASVNGTTTTILICSYRQYQAKEILPLQIEYNNLPAGWSKWKLWRLDSQAPSDGRPVLVSQGDPTNLPDGIELAATGIACLQLS